MKWIEVIVSFVIGLVLGALIAIGYHLATTLY